MKHIKIKIGGQVQKVGFRFSAMQTAYRYGVYGFIQNKPDGSVYIEAEGEEKMLELFLQWCQRGPYGAKVEKLESSEGEVRGYKAFDIIRSKS
jgi:acylphosphatase